MGEQVTVTRPLASAERQGTNQLTGGHTHDGQPQHRPVAAHVPQDGGGFESLFVGSGVHPLRQFREQRSIETIENDFNVPISHYLQVDFAGFRNIVNAIGSIPVYFPTPARDFYSLLSIPAAGCYSVKRIIGVPGSL